MGTVENEVVKDCLVWLQYNGFMAWRVNNMGVYRETGYSFNGTKGVPDLTAVKKGVVFFVECKAPGKLKAQSESQKEFQANLEKHGGIYILTDSVETLIQKIGEANG
jgi:Holliday junction resolvase